MLKNKDMTYGRDFFIDFLLDFLLTLIIKGQLISEWIYEVIVSPKIRIKIVKISALTTQGRNPDNFSFVFWEKRWLHKFILKQTDL